MATQRSELLNLCRGFAILGILWMNIYAFAWPVTGYSSLSWRLGEFSRSDELLYHLSHWLFAGRFMTLFCLLFGVGLWLQQQRYGDDYLARRLLWLMAIGAGHYLFIWYGDILLYYALCGWYLHKRRYLTLSSEQQWRKGLKYFAISLLVPSLMYAFLPNDSEFFIGELTPAEIAAEIELWTGPYGLQVWQQAQYLGFAVLDFVLSIFWQLTGLMLLGMALWQQRQLALVKLKQFAWPLFIAASLLSTLDSVLEWHQQYQFSKRDFSPLEPIAALMMALSYVAALAWLQHRPSTIAWWIRRALDRCGQLAFTLYILQSSLMILLFRHWQPHWFGQLDRIELVAIVGIASVLQLCLAMIYFQRWSVGPLEWAWRKLSGRPQSVQNTNATSPLEHHEH